ncbi:MAG TPA: hypothetical protein VLA99_05255 [Nitrospiraceae bacterium]|nr:hypothetical protein [Nitrospiraceae bacterium]
MRYTFSFVFVVLGAVAFVALAFANPAMLPQHPGYPMGKAVDPVTGKPLANDPGQTNATGDKALQQAAAFDDVHVKQDLSINQNDQRIVEKPGAGILPKVQGPQIKIEPPVKEATRVQAAPQ